MPNPNEELKSWHDWTNPDFFAGANKRERRIVPLFLRQLMPVRIQRTKLTLTGWMLILVAMGIGSAAYNTASNILFMTLSLLLSSLVLSGILSQINFHKLKWTLRAPQHLQVGEVGMAEVDVVNMKSIFPTMSICFRVGSSASDAEELLYLKQAMGAGEARQLEWTFVPSKRGRFVVNLSGAESQFPFGFLLKAMGASMTEEVLVWPERIEFEFTPENGGRRFFSGASKRNAGVGNDLLNIRPYERGDPPRLVHWKATARMGKLMIRQLAQEGEGGYHLYLDPDASRWNADQFETVCSLVCSLAEALFHAGRLESVRLEGASPTAIRSLAELHDFFDQLALLERREMPTEPVSHALPNLVTFRPLGERSIAIYVGENKAGQTFD
jgi:uncharacterized protein (DUF58 family)